MGYRYNRKRLLDTIDSYDFAPLTTNFLTIDEGTEFPMGAEILHAFLELTVTEALHGRLADLGDFPGTLVTAQTDPSDPRMRTLVLIERQFRVLLENGLVFFREPLPKSITAVQIIWQAGRVYARVGTAIDGVFWLIVHGGRLDIGHELHCSVRDEIAHLTVLYAMKNEQLAALVLWNLDPIPLNTPAGPHLQKLMAKSIGVKPVRDKWFRKKGQVSPGEIQSAFALAVKEGVHPDERGTYIAKIILGEEEPKELTFSELGADSDPDSLAPFVSNDWNPEASVLRDAEISEAVEVLTNIASGSDADGKRLLEAWRNILEEQEAGLTDVARIEGWDPKTAEAVLKRIRRQLGKNG